MPEAPNMDPTELQSMQLAKQIADPLHAYRKELLPQQTGAIIITVLVFSSSMFS
jgi:tRNA A37 threonylcarbamoyladenosine dehydratase